MNRYEMKIAKLEARTPQFYYPYSVRLKTDFAKEMIVLHLIRNGRLGSVTKNELDQIDEKTKEFSGKYVFHCNDPELTEENIKEQVRTGALNSLSSYAFFPNGPNYEHVRKYGALLRNGEDYEICIGDRVDIQQPKKLTFDDLPDLMGIEKEIKSFEGVES